MGHGRRALSVLLAVAGVVCLLLGAALLVRELRAGGDLGTPAAALVRDPLAGLPPAGSVPVRLDLPDRRITAPVVAVITGADGGLVVPERAATVGWWSPSAMPGGSGGTTVIAGHVDSRVDGLGALSALRWVEVGEPVLLYGADGREVRYRVVARRQYLKAALPRELFAVGGPPRLVLITCGGTFDRATRSYSDNVVVHAEPV
jgi:hypothetical protein